MCEFKVFLDGLKVAEDVVYVKQENGRLILRDIIGNTHTLDDAEIIEVDVLSTRLVLSHRQGGS